MRWRGPDLRGLLAYKIVGKPAQAVVRRPDTQKTNGTFFFFTFECMLFVLGPIVRLTLMVLDRWWLDGLIWRQVLCTVTCSTGMYRWRWLRTKQYHCWPDFFFLTARLTPNINSFFDEYRVERVAREIEKLIWLVDFEWIIASFSATNISMCRCITLVGLFWLLDWLIGFLVKNTSSHEHARTHHRLDWIPCWTQLIAWSLRLVEWSTYRPFALSNAHYDRILYCKALYH